MLAWPESPAASVTGVHGSAPASPLIRELAAGDGVRVWCADLDALAAQQEALESASPEDERQRAGTLPDALRRTRFVRARGVLRQRLADFVGAEAAARPFAYGADGKPALDGAPAPVHFNLSHARGVALVAIAFGRRVGVDLAATGGAIPLDKVIARFFSPPERSAVEAVPDAERRALFARIWVRKEAYLKGRGEGISEWIYTTDFSPASAGSAGREASRDQARWDVRDLPGLPDGYVGSVALERGAA